MQTTFSFEAIGTHWQIDINDPLSSTKKSRLQKSIFSLIEEFDKTYSRFRKDSLITEISQHTGLYKFPENAEKLFALYYDLYQLTGHKFTPLIGQTLSDAGYDAAYSLKSKKLHHPDNWEDVIVYDHPILTVKKPVLLDFGAAGKGYLIDLVGDLFKKQRISNFCIDAGGDILYQTTSDQKLRVGLEHPDHSDEVIGVAEISNQSICASAGNRRKWGNFHHIIDPESLSSPSTVKATWVIAETALLADALATCLFFCPAKILQTQYNFSYAVVYENLTLETSRNFPAEMFTTARYEYSGSR